MQVSPDITSIIGSPPSRVIHNSSFFLSSSTLLFSFRKGEDITAKLSSLLLAFYFILFFLSLFLFHDIDWNEF